MYFLVLCCIISILIGVTIGIRVQKRKDAIYIIQLHSFALKFKAQRDRLVGE